MTQETMMFFLPLRPDAEVITYQLERSIQPLELKEKPTKNVDKEDTSRLLATTAWTPMQVAAKDPQAPKT